MSTPPPIQSLPISRALRQELRSDHAGEAGAVQIYRGMLAVSRNASVRAFAREHLATEQRHLAFFDAWLDPATRTRALPLWRAAGWLLGASAALFGPDTVFRTVAAVERFVDGHYLAQLELIDGKPELVQLSETLAGFREDELEHRDDAAGRAPAADHWPAKAWDWLIGVGSAAGVVLAKRI